MEWQWPLSFRMRPYLGKHIRHSGKKNFLFFEIVIVEDATLSIWIHLKKCCFIHVPFPNYVVFVQNSLKAA